MTKIDFKAADKDCKTTASSLADDPEFVRTVVQDALNAVMEAEMSELLGADKSERTSSRRGYRSGYYRRKLTMRWGRWS